VSECDPSFAAGELDDEGCEPTDFEWDVIAPLLPNKPRGVPRVDHWRVLNCIFWVLRTGTPWHPCRIEKP
jgi:transposase